MNEGGRVAGIRLKGNLTLEIDQEIDPGLLASLFGCGDRSSQMQQPHPQPSIEQPHLALSPPLFSYPHPYANQMRPSSFPYPVSSQMVDWPGQYLSPPQ